MISTCYWHSNIWNIKSEIVRRKQRPRSTFFDTITIDLCVQAWKFTNLRAHSSTINYHLFLAREILLSIRNWYYIMSSKRIPKGGVMIMMCAYLLLMAWLLLMILIFVWPHGAQRCFFALWPMPEAGDFTYDGNESERWGSPAFRRSNPVFADILLTDVLNWPTNNGRILNKEWCFREMVVFSIAGRVQWKSAKTWHL